jgi:uncharacterized protein GlcG (DUF336 family)
MVWFSVKRRILIYVLLPALALPMTGKSAVPAQAAQADTPAARAADPRVLPGDSLNQSQQWSGQLKVDPGPPGGSPPTRPRVVDSTPSPGFELALEAARAALQSCEADGYQVGVAVSDAAGKLKVGLSGDDVSRGGLYTAARKNLTVVGFGMSTLALRGKIEADPSLMAQVKPNMVLLPGGIPIMKGDKLLGAIAVRGAMAREEEKCAMAGLQKIQSRLK